MVKKKKNEPIKGLGKDPENKLTVLKSRPLFAMWRSDFSLAEFKILDTYLARINSQRPEDRTVVFEKGKLEELLGVKRITRKELDARLKQLGTPIDLAKGDTKKIHRVPLFEEAYAEQDEHGVWMVRLTCTQKAMQYFFNIEELGYLRYKLRSITSLKSRYTYLLFVYLEANRFRKTWEVDVEELRQLLGCADDELYKEYKRFNERILKRCQQELHEKTECRFSYRPVKRGRAVAAVEFTLETLADILPEVEGLELPGQFTIDDYLDDEDQEPMVSEFDRLLDWYNEACEGEFTREQMQVIHSIIVEKDLPKQHESVDIDRYHYLIQKHALLKLKASQTTIKNRFNYFKVMIENDD